MKFDRGIFFEQYRRHFGQLKQFQVDGLSRLLTGFETYYGWWDDLRQIANALAQVGWETAWSYNPVVEGYYLGDASKAGYFSGNTDRVRNFQRSLRYFPHIGMGDIQLTWAENYADQDGRIRKWFPERVKDFEQRTGKKFNLVTNPEQALDGWISFCIFTIGMHLGTFRPGRNLDRYITPTKTDHFNARDIVNGDKNYVKQGKKIGVHIADAAKRFEAVLKASLVASTEPVFNFAEIEELADGIGSSSTVGDLAGSQQSLPQWPSTDAVESPLEEAGGFPLNFPPSPSVDQPIGDLPTAKPSSWLKVEDWKPLVFRWLKKIWGVTLPANMTQGGAFTFAAMNDAGNWYIWAGAAVLLFILISGAALLVSAVLLGIWYFNRKEIKDAKELEARLLADPTQKNIGVMIEKK